MTPEKAAEIMFEVVSSAFDIENLTEKQLKKLAESMVRELIKIRQKEGA